MGFFDSMKKEFYEESKKIKQARERNNYRTLEEQEQDQYNRINKNDIGALVRKLNDSSTSSNDKEIIILILRERSYRVGKNSKGQYALDR